MMSLALNNWAQKDNIHLFLFWRKFAGNALDSVDKLSNGRSPFSESMMFICQNVKPIEMPHGFAMNNMLPHLACSKALSRLTRHI